MGPFDPLADVTVRQLLELGMRHFYAFTLVLVRMSGLMIIGPMFGQPLVPPNIRILLVLVMALLITPTLSTQSDVGFQRLDVNQDGRLTRDEVPQALEARFDNLLKRTGKQNDAALQADEFAVPLEIPSTILDYAWVAIGEFALGFLLGLGVLTILSGLQLAGEMIDQQTGLALSEVFSPGFEMSASVSSRMLFLLGVTVFLVLEPVGGHLLMISALVETFQTLPVGEAFVATSAVDFALSLVHQSLVVAVGIVAPMLATMSLVALTMGYLGRSVPQVNVLVIGFAIRAMVNLLILSLMVSGAAKAVVDVLPATIDRMRFLLSG